MVRRGAENGVRFTFWVGRKDAEEGAGFIFRIMENDSDPVFDWIGVTSQDEARY